MHLLTAQLDNLLLCLAANWLIQQCNETKQQIPQNEQQQITVDTVTLKNQQ
jgi:hypothetical protein